MMSGCASPAFTSRLSRSMISGGVPRGTPIPAQVLASYPGTVSATVCTSGNRSNLLAPKTPSARSLPLRTCGRRRHHYVKPDLNLTANQIRRHRCAAAIWDVYHVDAGHELEQFAGQMRRRACAERRHSDLAGIGLGVRNQLGHRLRRH